MNSFGTPLCLSNDFALLLFCRGMQELLCAQPVGQKSLCTTVGKKLLLSFAGRKKKKRTPLAPGAELCREKWGPQRKDFGGGYGFPGFYRVFVSTTGLESFSLRPEKFSKRLSFGGGCVRFFLL